MSQLTCRSLSTILQKTSALVAERRASASEARLMIAKFCHVYSLLCFRESMRDSEHSRHIENMQWLLVR